MLHSITISELGDIRQAAREFIRLTAGHSLIAFQAPMGAGKTTFIKAVCEELGVRPDEIASPTFSIVNEYIGTSGESIFHFDFYRITKDEEALDIGLYDYLDSGCLCLMEWPENIAQLLPEECLDVRILVREDGGRELTWED